MVSQPCSCWAAFASRCEVTALGKNITAMVASTAISDITTNNSTRVKPLRVFLMSVSRQLEAVNVVVFEWSSDGRIDAHLRQKMPFGIHIQSERARVGLWIDTRTCRHNHGEVETSCVRRRRLGRQRIWIGDRMKLRLK